MIRTFIVEDSSENLANLLDLLTPNCPAVAIVGHTDNVNDAVAQIISLQPDLIFLDILLRGGTGFDLLTRLQAAGQLRAELIFLTGELRYDYVMRSFDYATIDFLNKPIDIEKLCRAVERAEQRLGQQQMQEKVKLLLDLVQSPVAKADGRMALHLVRGRIEVISVATSTHCVADGVITQVYRADGSHLTAVRNLGHYRDLLVQDYDFFSIDHSEIVNLAYLKHYDPQGRTLRLVNGIVRTASRRKGKELADYLRTNARTGSPAVAPSINSQLRSLVDQIRKWLT